MPRQYVLNTSKQFLNHFDSKYEMFWEAFGNSEKVTESFYLQRRLLKVLTHALTSTAETVLHVIQKHSIRKANTTMYKEREL